MLLLELSTTFTLLALDALALGQGQHLLVLDPQFATAELHMIECVDNGLRLLRRCEVGERQATEHTVVEVVVERIWKWQIHVDHKLNKLLFLHGEWDILDNNSGRYQFVVVIISATLQTRCVDGRRRLLLLLRPLRLIIPYLKRH